MPASPDPLETHAPQTFEAALHQLEAIVARLEEDEPDLEASIQAYEAGVQLARYCMSRLEQAELRVQQLALDDDS